MPVESWAEKAGGAMTAATPATAAIVKTTAFVLRDTRIFICYRIPSLAGCGVLVPCGQLRVDSVRGTVQLGHIGYKATAFTVDRSAV
ncbi:hypothetical protein Acsp05_52150 [Actinokineospora sp. NBRC 105648]|nr:hypothetical protein Acsp05_52150 [Actinokineospora sp. NBRC 105648]